MKSLFLRRTQRLPTRTNPKAPPTCLFITLDMPARVRSIYYPIPPQPNQHPGIAAGVDQCFYCGRFGHCQEQCHDHHLQKPRSAKDFQDWRRVSCNHKWYSVVALWPSCAPRPRRNNTPAAALESTAAFITALNDVSEYTLPVSSSLGQASEDSEDANHSEDSNNESEPDVSLPLGSKHSCEANDGSPRASKRPKMARSQSV